MDTTGPKKKRLPRIVVTSDQDVVTNAKVEVEFENEKVDISRCVSRIGWNVQVGEVSTIDLSLITADVRVSGYADERTLDAFAETLRLRGYAVVAPEDGRPRRSFLSRLRRKYLIDITAFGADSYRYVKGQERRRRSITVEIKAADASQFRGALGQMQREIARARSMR